MPRCVPERVSGFNLALLNEPESDDDDEEEEKRKKKQAEKKKQPKKRGKKVASTKSPAGGEEGMSSTSGALVGADAEGSVLARKKANKKTKSKASRTVHPHIMCGVTLPFTLQYISQL